MGTRSLRNRGRLRHRGGYVVGAVVLLAASLTAADWTAIVKPASGGVVRIEMQTDDGAGICSGAVLNADAGFVLTAAHCTRHAPATSLSLTVNGRHADLVRENRILDLAIIRFEAHKEHALVLAADTPPVGSEVALLGFAFGSKLLSIQFGRVALPLNEDGELMLDVATIRGDSGGPAIDAAGHLVGMTSAIKQSGGYLAVMVPVEAVREFVKPYLPPPVKP